MKKLLLLTSALCLLGSYTANAQVSVTLGAPVYVAPYYQGYVYAPNYPSYHYDRHRHAHNDYWANRDRDDHDRWEHDNRR